MGWTSGPRACSPTSASTAPSRPASCTTPASSALSAVCWSVTQQASHICARLWSHMPPASQLQGWVQQQAPCPSLPHAPHSLFMCQNRIQSPLSTWPLAWTTAHHKRGLDLGQQVLWVACPQPLEQQQQLQGWAGYASPKPGSRGVARQYSALVPAACRRYGSSTRLVACPSSSLRWTAGTLGTACTVWSPATRCHPPSWQAPQPLPCCPAPPPCPPIRAPSRRRLTLWR
mmetsp:Transcript_12358/g.26698  ORF Transcript_12358/g.26698 Transcript_12358/m.26698 type:complete len:230 (+) Transcript_12358:453-1142(+)